MNKFNIYYNDGAKIGILSANVYNKNIFKFNNFNQTIMKKILLAAMIALTGVSFVSCSSDDDSKEVKANLTEILGSWEETIVESGEDSKTEVITTWTFNANKTATERVEGYLTTSYTGRVSVIDITLDFTYEYDGKKVIFTSTSTTVKNPTTTYNIEINGNKMRMGNDEGGYFNLTKK